MRKFPLSNCEIVGHQSGVADSEDIIQIYPHKPHRKTFEKAIKDGTINLNLNKGDQRKQFTLQKLKALQQTSTIQDMQDILDNLSETDLDPEEQQEKHRIEKDTLKSKFGVQSFYVFKKNDD